jgi:sulfur-oxidizing protein SoxX
MSVMRSMCVFTALFCLIIGCAPAPESGRAFRLPDGNSIAGKQVFLRLQCHACHKIIGVDLPPINLEPPVTVTLGGPTARVKTYGELVTSIINPSHKLIKRYPEQEISSDGQSFMPTVNELMTVQELVDLVAFLQDSYQVVMPEPYPYKTYYSP